MFRIVTKRRLNETVTLMEIEAPDVAKNGWPSVHLSGSTSSLARTPYHRGYGPFSRNRYYYIQSSPLTMLLGQLEAATHLRFRRPLGLRRIDGVKKAAIVGGGVGNAIAYPPQRRFLIFARRSTSKRASVEDIISEDEMRAVSRNYYLMRTTARPGKRASRQRSSKPCSKPALHTTWSSPSARSS
jgi:ferredoxin--NADP+ reductase